MAREALAEPGDVDSLIEQGVELRERGQDDKALEQFTRAFQLSHGPPAQAQMALAEQALGHWVRAEANLVAALLAKEDPWIERHRDSLERALTTIREHIGDLELRGGVPEAQVLIDGRPVGKLPLERPIRVEAGTCVLDIKAAGYYPFSRTVTITANGTSRETVEMTARQGEEPARGGTPAPSSTKAVLPAPEPESSGARSVRRAFVWGTAIGATGFAVLGTTALVLQNGKRGDYNDGRFVSWHGNAAKRTALGLFGPALLGRYVENPHVGRVPGRRSARSHQRHAPPDHARRWRFGWVEPALRTFLRGRRAMSGNVLAMCHDARSLFVLLFPFISACTSLKETESRARSDPGGGSGGARSGDRDARAPVPDASNADVQDARVPVAPPVTPDGAPRELPDARAADAAPDAPAVDPCATAHPVAGTTCPFENDPSCGNGSSTCGPRHDESCCTSTLVPGGKYVRSADASRDGEPGRSAVVGHQQLSSPSVEVSPFWLDRYEVTVARFRRFIDTYDTWRDNKPFAGDGALHGVPGTGWSLALSQSLPQNKSGILASFTATPGVTSCGNQVAWTDAPGVNEGKPITCVTWYVAYAFCIWDGGRLPTEAEWNFAAAGGEVQRAFPWSDPASDRSAPKNLANLDNSLGLRDVGTSAGAGYYGHADLSGNAFEWTRDGCDDCQAPNASAPGPELLTYAVESCTDCLTKEGTSRIIRGGSFKFPTITGRTAYRGSNPSANPFDDIGFRCARDPND